MEKTIDPKPTLHAMGEKGIHDKVLGFFDTLPRGKVLDSPCGVGALSRPLHELGFTVTACDICDNLQAKEVAFQLTDLNDDLPFADGSFDQVACVEGIEHVENSYKLLREFSRVLKPGGHLVLTTPNVLNIASRIRFLLGSHHRRFKTIEPGGHLVPVSLQMLRYGFEKAGLTIEQITTNQTRRKWGLFYPLIRMAIRQGTRRHYPGDDELLRPEVLNGSILVFLIRKNSAGPGAEHG